MWITWKVPPLITHHIKIPYFTIEYVAQRMGVRELSTRIEALSYTIKSGQ